MPWPDQQLRQMVLQLADAVLREQLDGGLDLAGQRRRILDRRGPASTAAPIRSSGTTAPARQPSDSSCLMSFSRATWSGG